MALEKSMPGPPPMHLIRRMRIMTRMLPPIVFHTDRIIMSESNGRLSTPRRANRLANERSPYLLQHAHNPVDWRPWGDEAFAAAAAEDKPVFLSIGYSACHWCHVMERESFEDPQTAELLNARFVSIKVDREE